MTACFFDMSRDSWRWAELSKRTAASVYSAHELNAVEFYRCVMHRRLISFRIPGGRKNMGLASLGGQIHVFSEHEHMKLPKATSGALSNGASPGC